MRPPAKVHDPKRASVSVSARSFDKIRNVAAERGESISKFVEARINAYLDEKEQV